MRKFLIIIIVILWASAIIPRLNNMRHPEARRAEGSYEILRRFTPQDDINAQISKALELLRSRQDSNALEIFEEILKTDPNNITATWGKAESLRRNRDYTQAEDMLKKILLVNPNHAPSLISKAYLRYKEDKLDDALKIINNTLKNKELNRENKALDFMMLGSINSRRSQKSWLFGKIAFGTQIKGYFLKAEALAPELPEVHLGLGTFYLLAPAIIGGDVNKALEEFKLCLKISPNFATANARIAQAYKKLNNLEKYNFYITRAKELDPKNEILLNLYRTTKLN